MEALGTTWFAFMGILFRIFAARDNVTGDASFPAPPLDAVVPKIFLRQLAVKEAGLWTLRLLESDGK